VNFFVKLVIFTEKPVAALKLRKWELIYFRRRMSSINFTYCLDIPKDNNKERKLMCERDFS